MARCSERFQRAGYFVWPSFLKPSECDALRLHAEKLADELMRSEPDGMTFSSGEETADDDRYLIESAHRIRPFYEIVQNRHSVRVCNKIGHALHVLDPVFAQLARHPAWQLVNHELELDDPQICQSMVIFKHAQVGGAVQWHQDGTFLHAEPHPVTGFWLALEDANIDNGCLWVAPGSHRHGLRRRYIRTAAGKLEFLKSSSESSPVLDGRALPVSKGTLVILHGWLSHRSLPNHSNRGRCAVTFHTVPASSQLDAHNWIGSAVLCPLGRPHET